MEIVKIRDCMVRGDALSKTGTVVWEFLDFLNSCFLAAFPPNMLTLAETTNLKVPFHVGNHFVQFD